MREQPMQQNEAKALDTVMLKKFYIGQKRVQWMELHQHTWKCRDMAEKHEQGPATKTLQPEIHARPKKDNKMTKNYWVTIWKDSIRILKESHVLIHWRVGLKLLLEKESVASGRQGVQSPAQEKRTTVLSIVRNWKAKRMKSHNAKKLALFLSMRVWLWRACTRGGLIIDISPSKWGLPLHKGRRTSDTRIWSLSFVMMN